MNRIIAVQKDMLSAHFSPFSLRRLLKRDGICNLTLQVINIILQKNKQIVINACMLYFPKQLNDPSESAIL